MKEVTKRHTTVSHGGTGSSMQHAPTREVTKRHTAVSHGRPGSSVHRLGKSLSVTQRWHTGDQEAACTDEGSHWASHSGVTRENGKQRAPTREVTKRHTAVSHGRMGSTLHRRGKSLSVTQRCHTGDREAACTDEGSHWASHSGVTRGNGKQRAPTREVTKHHTAVSHGRTGSTLHRRGKSLSVTQRCHTGDREAACTDEGSH